MKPSSTGGIGFGGSVKSALLQQLASAFDGRRDMSLLPALDGVTDEFAVWRPSPDTPSIEQIARHIAWSKNRFCQQGFGVKMILDDPAVDDEGDTDGVPWEFPCGCMWGATLLPGVVGAIDLLRATHEVMRGCLEGLDEAALAAPLPVRHGETAFHFFWTMIMHDLFHAGQIRTRRILAALA